MLRKVSESECELLGTNSLQQNFWQVESATKKCPNQIWQQQCVPQAWTWIWRSNWKPFWIDQNGPSCWILVIFESYSFRPPRQAIAEGYILFQGDCNGKLRIWFWRWDTFDLAIDRPCTPITYYVSRSALLIWRPRLLRRGLLLWRRYS